MSVLGIVSRGVEQLARHPELVDLVLHAVEHGGVDEAELIRIIKDKMTEAANEQMRRELAR
jgi:hypothetical protein